MLYQPTRLKRCAWAVAVLAALALVVTAVSPVAAGATLSTSPVFYFANGAVVPGSSSTLVRNNAGVTMTIHTSDLPGGDAFTVWWVIFNHPANCSGGACGEDDVVNAALGNPDPVQVGVLYATGHVIGANGVANFGAYLMAGDTSGCQSSLPAPLCKPLMSASGAEIHLVIRSHGPPIPGMVKEQTSSFDGGCSINVCEDPQGAVHKP